MIYKVVTEGLAPNGLQVREFYSLIDARISRDIDLKAGAKRTAIFENGYVMEVLINN